MIDWNSRYLKLNQNRPEFMNQTSGYHDKNYNRITLSFKDQKEEEPFKLMYFSNSIFQFRFSFVVVTLLYGVFAFLDNKIVPEYAELFHIIRFYFVVPLLTFTLIYSFSRGFEKTWQLLTLLCVVAGGAGISVMTMLVPDNYTYYAGMMLVFSANYFFIRLWFVYATIAGWLILLIYTTGAFFFTSTPEDLITSNNFFFISANLIGMFAAYHIELYDRRNFILNKKLDFEKFQVEEINRNLEEIVKERTKDLLKAMEKAQESDRLKTAFLANMSHEIRTPMNGILGFTQLLKFTELDSKQQHEYIEIIEKSGARMLNIINDIIDISKIEAGLITCRISPTNINEQLKQIYTFFRPQAINRNLHFSYSTTLSDIDAWIETDTEKFFAIFSNLVKNALKFCDEGSIEFGYIKKGDVLEFYVKDTGIGIPEERQQAIFERFIQADIEDRRAAQGAGLGLSIAKAYTECMGGNIWVKSKEGSGSVFYFTIPYKPISRTIIVDENSLNNNSIVKVKDKKLSKKFKVLVAEDDEVSEKLLKIILAKCTDILFTAGSGTEVLEILSHHQDIDLILMDIQMPEMNGLEATRRIRETNKDIVIVAQTAFGMSGDREKAIDAGCNDYISKPLKKEEVQAILTKYFSKNC